jgi:hypothetical protein
MGCSMKRDASDCLKIDAFMARNCLFIPCWILLSSESNRPMESLSVKVHRWALLAALFLSIPTLRGQVYPPSDDPGPRPEGVEVPPDASRPGMERFLRIAPLGAAPELVSVPGGMVSTGPRADLGRAGRGDDEQVCLRGDSCGYHASDRSEHCLHRCGQRRCLGKRPMRRRRARRGQPRRVTCPRCRLGRSLLIRSMPPCRRSGRGRDVSVVSLDSAEAVPSFEDDRRRSELDGGGRRRCVEWKKHLGDCRPWKHDPRLGEHGRQSGQHQSGGLGAAPMEARRSPRSR